MAFVLIFWAQSAWSYQVSGNTYLTNGSQSDVQAACSAAPDHGSITVLIPNGSYKWTGTLTIAKAVNLKGESQSGVVITNQNSTGDMILVKGSTKANTTISNVSFVDGVANSNYLFVLDVDRNINSSYTVCVYNCSFNQNGIFGYSARCLANGIIWWGDTFIGSGENGCAGISFVCDRYGYISSWNTPETMGKNDTTGLNNSYVEDCRFYDAPTACCNFDDNSRVVWRYNAMNNASLGSHGQETSVYGTRHWEVYNNTFSYSASGAGPTGATYPLNMNYWFFVRGGTGVITNNAMDDIPNKTGIMLNVFSITRGMNDGREGSFCPIAYPAPRQTGWGWSSRSRAYWGFGQDKNTSLLVGGKSPGAFAPDGMGAAIDPVYIWNNTGTETADPGYVGKQTYEPDNCGNGQVISTYLQQNRDYFVNVASPKWTPYIYPHPLHTAYASGRPVLSR